MSVSPGRRIALEVLERVEEGGAFASAALSAAIDRAGVIDPRERGLATELCYGTLRQMPALDFRIAQVSSRAPDAIEPRVRHLLRLGAYQLLHLRVPDHAAVSETVEQARALHLERAVGFINAVLRALIPLRTQALAPPLAVDPAMHLLIEAGLPTWLFENFRAALSIEEVARLAVAINQPAPLSLRADSAAARDAAIASLEASGKTSGEGACVSARPAARAPEGLIIETGGSPERLPGWESLGLQAQDEAAQLVTHFALAPGPIPLEIKTVLDPCAAPGGKCAHLAQALPAARILASDLHRSRVGRLTRELDRLGLAGRVEVVAADATKPLPHLPEGGVDLLLLDAPCSGLGTLRRNPEIKIRRGPEDIARLADLQARLLAALSACVAPGGRLVYVVCTFSPAETLEQVARFEREHPAFSREAVVSEAPSFQGLVDDDGLFFTWPHRDDTDGFFACRFRRAL